MNKTKSYLGQKTRIIILFLYVILLVFLTRLITNVWFPTSSGERLWLLSAIAYLTFKSLNDPWYSPPTDSFTNSTTSCLLLAFIKLDTLPFLASTLNTFRWTVFSVFLVTALSALTAMILKDNISGKLGYLRLISFKFSSELGKGELVFTPPVLISIVGFYQLHITQLLYLLIAWMILVLIHPIEIVWSLILSIRSEIGTDLKSAGIINRIDDPHIVRITLSPDEQWNSGDIYMGSLPNGNQIRILSLFKHYHEDHLIGTGYICGNCEVQSHNPPLMVYKYDTDITAEQIICEMSGEVGGIDFIGFVVEDSNISDIKFEISSEIELEEGMLVFCNQNSKKVYYQIIDAKTAEEVIGNPRGKQIAIASQLGILNPAKGFIKYGWLPSMNSPVFKPKSEIESDELKINDDDFEVGFIPGTKIPVFACYRQLHEYHAAILGVTGTGKTELSLDIIKKGLTQPLSKIICIDFTGEYRQRLKDNDAIILDLEAEQIEKLQERIFQVEIGEYGAKKEIKELSSYIDQELKPYIISQINSFLSPTDASLGILELKDIYNSKASLRITELYLSSIMSWARDNRKARRILVVLEEAHTIIPETMGAGFDYDTQWVVGRISQIALQGRKYGVGLLLISQRTALVSKSILSQCNTHFTFSLVDKTSLDFLTNVYSQKHVNAIPNLKRFHLLTYGKAIKTERPVIVEILYDPTKETESRALDYKDESTTTSES